jgi:hypothetical protein
MTLPAQLSPRVRALFEKTQRNRGRLIFALDATASRGATWDLAAQLQAQMFEVAAKIGGLQVQLVWYRGAHEFASTAWTTDACEIATRMAGMRCEAGATKIMRMLRHVQKENAREKVSAAVFVGDAVEEPPQELYAAAAEVKVPLFLFQEGDGFALYVDEHGGFAVEHPVQTVEEVFRELARLSGGAYEKFNAGAAKQLGELLRAVAAFAVGGLTALADLRSESARKLLTQMKDRP